MPGFGDYIVFVDESGDHGLVSIDANYPVFVLAFAIFEKAVYTRQVVPALMDFKFKYFGHDQVILHEHDIRKNKGPFGILRKTEVREPFMEDLNGLIRTSAFTLVAGVIRKEEHKARYADPPNPYHTAMEFGLERVYMELHGRGCRTGSTHILFERRGQKEDAEVELEFRRICASNATGKRLPFEPVLCHKTCNSPGLQLSDLIARPIGRKIIAPEQPNRAYDIIQSKFRRSRGGNVLGYGLKIFP
ncbi:MAG TPA: DUF3800 domain-containing protein [Longimicrobium sp.]|nr:DUF3800 domain-containing protein [Longimicrobium sp.]